MSRAQQPVSDSEHRLFFTLPLKVLSVFVILDLLVPGFSERFAGWPVVLSLFLIGMPHGAVDLLVAARLRNASDLTGVVRSFLGYSWILLATLLAFLLVPPLAIVGFVVVSVLHFGLADARSLESRFGVHGLPVVIKAAAICRGTLILGLPFAVYPQASWQVFRDVLSIVGYDAPPLLLAVQPVAIGLCVVAGLVQAAVTTRRFLDGNLQAARAEVGETVTIAAAFVLLDPLFAMGLYVIAWHSWRHMQPLARLFDHRKERVPPASIRLRPAQPRYRELLGSVARLHAYSLPLLLPTLCVFALVGRWRLDDWSAESMAALTIAIFVVVTIPHHVLIERLMAKHRVHDAAKQERRRVEFTYLARRVSQP